MSSVTGWARIFSCRGGKLTASSLKEADLSDQELISLSRYLSSKCLPNCRASLQLKASAPLPLKELNLSGNSISDAGVSALVDALLQQRVQLQKLWLQSNRIGAGGAAAVATLIQKAPKPLEEIHLSHNFLEKDEVRWLLVATANRQEYPLKGPEGLNRPLWLRVEHNPCCKTLTNEMIEEAEEKLLDIRQRLSFMPRRSKGRMICIVPWVAGGCKSSQCKYSHKHGPIIHLPYFWRDTSKTKRPEKNKQERKNAGTHESSNAGSGGVRRVLLAEKPMVSKRDSLSSAWKSTEENSARQDPWACYCRAGPDTNPASKKAVSVMPAAPPREDLDMELIRELKDILLEKKKDEDQDWVTWPAWDQIESEYRLTATSACSVHGDGQIKEECEEVTTHDSDHDGEYDVESEVSHEVVSEEKLSHDEMRTIIRDGMMECEKDGQWQRALALLEEMRSAGVSPDVMSWGSAILACEKSGEWQRALALFDEMRAAGVIPNVIAFSAAISACAKGRQRKRALSLMEEMWRISGHAPSSASPSCTATASVGTASVASSAPSETGAQARQAGATDEDAIDSAVAEVVLAKAGTAETGLVEATHDMETGGTPDDELLVQRLVEYLRRSPDPEKAKLVIRHAQSGVQAAASQAAVDRFDAESARQTAQSWQ